MGRNETMLLLGLMAYTAIVFLLGVAAGGWFW